MTPFPVYGMAEPVPTPTEPIVKLSPDETVFENLGKYVAKVIVDEAVDLYGPGQTP